MVQIQQRAVSGSFIFKFPADDISKKPLVALFQRSANVKTYRHKYAPISGSVESTDPTPLATAWRELKEETSLTRDSLQLFRQGKPYSFVDESIGREWIINPFGFLLKAGGRGESGIKLDWEHDSFKWFDPDEIAKSDSFPGVPRLLDSLRRVWFNLDIGNAAGDHLSTGLVALQKDHESGARQLASKALDIFISTIPSLGLLPAQLWWEKVRFVAWHIWKNGRESMTAPTLNTLLRALEMIQDRMPQDKTRDVDHRLVADVVGVLERYSQERQRTSLQENALLGDLLQQTLPDSRPLKVLTLSSSSTIISGLTHLLRTKPTPLDVRVLESRPLFEGVEAADKVLTAARENSPETKVTVFTDANVSAAADAVDILLLGADAIDSAGNVSNKAGSLSAALVAKYRSPTVQIIVLADMEKIMPFENPPREQNDPQEVVQAWGNTHRTFIEPGRAQLDVDNTYFEWVPSELIDRFVLQEGILPKADIPLVAKTIRDRASRFFGSI